MATTSKPKSKPVSFADATRVDRVSPGIYRGLINENYCSIYPVPNGGYVASIILQAASDHTVARGQPDTISAHLTYVDRLVVGPALIVVEDIKAGKTVSNIHITLYQQDLQDETPFITSKSRKQIVGYLIQGNISRERGLSLDTNWSLLPAPSPAPAPSPSLSPTPDFTALPVDKDPHWTRTSLSPRFGGMMSTPVLKYASFLKTLDFFHPRQPGRRGLEDAWLRHASGERFTAASLGYVADSLMWVIEGWRPHKEEEEEEDKEGKEGKRKEKGKVPFGHLDLIWYATLSTALDVKKALPVEGVEWLFVRTSARKIQNGRFDLSVTILDQAGDLVAVASHVNMAMPATTGKPKKVKAVESSKI